MEISKSRIEVAFEGLVSLDAKCWKKAREASDIEDESTREAMQEKTQTMFAILDASHKMLEDLLGVRFEIGIEKCYLKDYSELWTKKDGLNMFVLEG